MEPGLSDQDDFERGDDEPVGFRAAMEPGLSDQDDTLAGNTLSAGDYAAMEPGLSDQDDPVDTPLTAAAALSPQWSLVFPTRMTGFRW